MTKTEQEYQDFVDDLRVAIQNGMVVEGGEVTGFCTDTAIDAIIDILIQHQLIIVIKEEDQN